MTDEAGGSNPPSSSVGHVGAWVDWIFRNRETGRITIAQLPNAPLWTFLLSTAVSWVVPDHSTAHAVFNGVSTAALAWWAIDEVLRGVNPWRRVLGVAGCGYVVLRILAAL